MPKPRLTVHLYSEPTTQERQPPVVLDIERYLCSRWPALDVVTGSWPPHMDGEDPAPVWAMAKVSHVGRPWEDREPLPMEVEYERRRLRGETGGSFGFLYDGIMLIQAFWGLVPPDERNDAHLHVILTDQMVGTWDEATGRYHAHVAMFAVPCLISLSGVVEAPAKPPEYYWIKQSGFGGMSDAIADQYLAQNADRIVSYGDGRLPEVVKGYVAQTLMYHLLGKPFCSDPGCRLYDARWQHELVAAQLDGDSEFCPGHEALLAQLIGGDNVARAGTQA